MAKIAAKSLIQTTFKGPVNVTQNAGDANGDQFSLGYSPADKIGMRIRYVEYFLLKGQSSVSIYTALAATGDAIAVGLSMSDPAFGATALTPATKGGIFDYNVLERMDTGAAAQANFIRDPFFSKNMCERDPDGVLVHPSSLWLWGLTINAVGSSWDVSCKLYYTLQELSDADYQEMLNTLLLYKS